MHNAYLACLLLLLPAPSLCFNLTLSSPSTPHPQIYINSSLQSYYNSNRYHQLTTCTNGQFTIVQFMRNQTQPRIVLQYAGIQIEDVYVYGKFVEPMPSLLSMGGGRIELGTGCKGEDTDDTNYYNEVVIVVADAESGHRYRAELLLGCDRGGKNNKKFELGYIIIALINAAITIGVALHSRIWSIRFRGRPLSYQLRWYRITIMMAVLVGVSVVIYRLTAKQGFINANGLLRYLGLAISCIFVFICADEVLFLVRRFKQQVYGRIRICDILSVMVAAGMTTLGCFIEYWFYDDILAIAICIGAIKLLRFRNMYQAYLSMAINVVVVTIASNIAHAELQRSYNDYASQLQSPLFILIPDMIDQLYKKCSWLPTLDVIIPGVFLSFLRTYDENYNTGWGGVYTVIGNLSFILSTLLWILLEFVYPYSIPFSLITYTSLGLAIWVLAVKRNEWKTLWEGRFNGANNELTTLVLEGERRSFGAMVTEEVVSGARLGASRYSWEEDDAHGQ